MTDFLDGGGIFLGGSPTPPVVPESDFDLGERVYNAGYSGEIYWGRSLGVIFPLSLLDRVGIGTASILYDEKLHVAGKILVDDGLILSNTISITKDGSNNLVFTDPVSGSKTLAQLIASGTGNVLSSGTPTNLQLAQWINATTIQGIDISSLVLTQAQITGLVTALAGKASTIHNLIDSTNHPVSGLTAGHFLKALSASTYGFAVHGLTKTDIGLSNVTNDAQVKKISSAVNNAITRWDGTSGSQIKNSLSILGDDGSIDIPTGATFNINGSPHAHAGQYQAVDGTLTALAGLDGSSGFIYQTGADAFTKYAFAGSGTANTVSRSDHNHSGVYLTGNQSITLSGDATGTGTQAITVTLATVNANTYGTNTFLKFAVNGKGLIISAAVVVEADIQGVIGSKTANYVYASPSGSAGSPTFRALVALDIPTIAQSQVINLVSDLSGKQTADAKLTTYVALATSTGYLYNNGSGTLSWGTPGGGGNVNSSGTPTNGQLAQWINATTIQGIAQSSLATDAFGALTDITTNNATTGQHGFLPKLGGGTTNFLRADGTWAAPSGGTFSDNILDYDSGNTWYAPYSNANKAAGRLYTYTATAPSNATELAYDGYFRATQLYEGTTRVLTSIPAAVVRTDQVNSYGDFAQTFKDNIIRINNPADTFYYTITAGAIGANRILNLPVITADDTIMVLELAQTVTGTKTFYSSGLKLNNPGNTFAYTFVSAAIAADRSITLPLLTGNDTMVTEVFNQTLTNKTISAANNTLTGVARTDAANTFGDFNSVFRSSRLIMTNPANTFNYTFIGAAIGAARNITLPLLTGDDTMVTAAFTQTLTGKTINATDNTIIDTSQAAGDLLKNNGTKFVRFARGSALYVLRVNSGGTDLEYVTPPWSVVTPAALTKIDDTNVTLTLGGTPATALLQAVSLTLGWTGTLADGRIASAATWNAKQAGSANLTSLSGLSYVSASFVKMTGANTFTLDTNTYSVSSHVHAESTITFTDITTNNATTGQHGYLPKLGGGTTNFFRADGTWAAPPGGVTPVDSTLLDWSTDRYQPYAAASAGAFDSSATVPTGTTRMNYGGYFYATRFYGTDIHLTGGLWVTDTGDAGYFSNTTLILDATDALIYNDYGVGTGHLTIHASDGFSTSNGGNLKLYAGKPLGAGAYGTVYIGGRTGNNSAILYPTGGVELYYNGTKKIETTSDGITVSGNAVWTGGSSAWVVQGDGAWCSRACPVTWDSTHASMWKAGFWDANGSSTTPDTSWWWGLTMSHRSNTSSYNYGGQIIIANGSDDMRFRYISGGSVGPWRRLWSTGDFAINGMSNNRMVTMGSGSFEGEPALLYDGSDITLNTADTVYNGLRITYNNSTTEGFRMTYLNSGATVSRLDSVYDSATAVMEFRMRTNGTPITALKLYGDGDSDIGVSGSHIGIAGTHSGSYNLYVTGTIYATGNITGNSDMRFKDKLFDEPDPWLRGYDKIDVIRFIYKKDTKENVGYSAQNLRSYFPVCVNEDSTGRLGIHHLPMIALNTLAIQKVKSEVDILKERIEELENKVKRLQEAA